MPVILQTTANGQPVLSKPQTSVNRDAERRNSYTPCDSVQTSSVQLELKLENRSFVVAALKSLGHSVVESGETVTFYTRNGLSGRFLNGQLTVTGRSGQAEAFNVNPLKRAYSTQVVKTASKRFGWKLSETKQEHVFDVEKKGF